MASERHVAGVATSSTPTPRSLIRSGSSNRTPAAPPTRGPTVPPSPDRWTEAASRPGRATTDSQARSDLRDRVPVRPDHVPMLPTAVVSRGRGSATSRRGRFAIDPGAKARRRRDDLARRRHDAAHGRSPEGAPCRSLKRCHRKMTRQSAWTQPGGSTSLPVDVATGGRVLRSTEPHSSEASSPLHGASLDTSPKGRDSLGVAGSAMAAAVPVVAHQHHAARPQWPGTILTLRTRGPRPRRRCCHQRRASQHIGAPREGSAHLATQTLETRLTDEPRADVATDTQPRAVARPRRHPHAGSTATSSSPRGERGFGRSDTQATPTVARRCHATRTVRAQGTHQRSTPRGPAAPSVATGCRSFGAKRRHRPPKGTVTGACTTRCARCRSSQSGACTPDRSDQRGTLSSAGAVPAVPSFISWTSR
jgi:hypothetical protein